METLPCLIVIILCTALKVVCENNSAMSTESHGSDETPDDRSPQDSKTHGDELVYHHNTDVANMSVYYTNSKVTRYINMKFTSEEVFDHLNCRVVTSIPNLDKEIRDLFRGEVKLLEYEFYFKNRTSNPLLTNSNWTYKSNIWDRVAHSHGQTILDLAFNYGVLSLMTLSFGVVKMSVELQEQPANCLSNLNETEKIQVMLKLLLRDMDDDGRVQVYEGESVCHQIIKIENSFAKFTDQCCFKKITTGEIICTMDIPNMWLSLLDALLIIFVVSVFLFGPIVCMKLFYAQTLDTYKYTVTLKEPLYKTVCICQETIDVDVMARHVLDLRNRKTFMKSRALASKLPQETIIPIKISEFNIDVNYAKLLPENEVPVGVLTCLSKAIFFCKLREVNAFQDCCEANVFGMLRYNNPFPWIRICYLIGRILLVLLVPLPYYVRLGLYYSFEHAEVMDRVEAAERFGLPMWFEYRLLHYLTPTHPLLITMYIIYFVTGLSLAILASFKSDMIFKTIVIRSLRDLFSVSWLDAVEMVVRNFLWPFRKMGIFGLLFGIVYWPTVMPLCILACLFYCTPLLFLSCRLITHALGLSSQDDDGRANVLPGEMKLLPTGMQLMEADKLFNIFTRRNSSKSRVFRVFKRQGMVRILVNFFLSLTCILALVSVMVMFTECVTYVLQICIFTMMGIIVNAGKVLKYGTLIFLVVLYSYDCYNNVYKQYLKLNKALFSEIKGRIKDLKEVTSLPSHLQKNVGFKAAEASEQADYEITDDLVKGSPGHLIINDLILFIDNDDFPRIPHKLFDEVCEIRVPGSPGPVYLSLLAATGKFFFIILFLVFVFVVVLSFGEVYKMSGTNQMLATMAGGFMPMIFSNILKPANPDVELGSVSFKSKLEEVIINFWQIWPMVDFPFDVEDKEEEDSHDDDDGSGNESGDDKKKKDKDDGKKKNDKDKDKDKNKNGGPKKSFGSKFSMDYLSDDDTSVNEEELQEKLETLQQIRSASGEYVDVLILLPNPDEMSWVDIPEVNGTELLKPIPIRNGRLCSV